MRSRIRTLVVLSLFPFVFLTAQVERRADITAQELRYHLEFLASDQLEGRKTGSRGADLAAAYLAREFARIGLLPKGDSGSYLQEFEFTAGVSLGPKNSAAAVIKGDSLPLQLNTDFIPLGFSSNGSFAGGVVFAGYGITAPEKQYDDYAGLDVKGRAVLLMRFHPEGDKRDSQFNKYAELRYKTSKAKELGAAAILLVTGPSDADEDRLSKLSYDNRMGNAGIPTLNITQKTADRLLSAAGTTLKALQDSINATTQPSSLVLPGISLAFSTDLIETRQRSSNIVGYLEGADPVLSGELIILGAHYDHLGYGGEGSGSLLPDTVAVHNGADDNGSGTVGLLELAQWFGAHQSELRRSMLFLAFTGEEMGLLGSNHYVSAPAIPLEKTVAMLNMDMIGRLRDRRLIVYGTGTSPSFESLLSRFNADSAFSLTLNKDGFGPSDQSSFYAKHIPVFHFFTDLHDDYHKPSDDADRISYDGMVKVLEYIRAIAYELVRADERPAYAQVEMPRPAGGMGRGVRSYTGTIPDFGEQTDGMKLSGVREGSPAARAGLQGGDVIIKFGKVEIKNLYDYTYALGEYKPGDTVEVEYRRGSERRTTTLTLERRSP